MSNYNLSNLTASNNTLEYALAINTLTGEAFFLLVLSLIFVISFVSMKNFDTKSAFMSSSFITTFASAILWSVGLVNEATLIVVFTILLISVFLKSQD